MAFVNAGTGSLDMTHLQLMSMQSASTPTYNSTLVRLDDGSGHFDDVQGSGFRYMSGGGYYDYGYGTTYDPISGVVTALSESSGAGVSMSMQGMSVDAATLFSDLRTGDTSGMMNLLFGTPDQITGGAAGDILDGWAGNDTVTGGEGADSIRGFEDNDQVDGGPGSDDVNGNTGDDIVHGGDDADLVRGGQGNDTVFGDAGDDFHVNGNIGNDEVHGGAGNDTVFGGQNEDVVMGEDGDDQLSGDLGNDTLIGGAGADRFMFRPGSSHDVINDFNAADGDRIVLPAGVSFSVVDVDGHAVIDLGGGDQLSVLGVTAAGFDTGWVVFA